MTSLCSCLKNGNNCDYRIRLNWEGRRIKRRNGADEPDETLASPTLFSNEFLVDSTAADTIGVPLQRYATEPNSTNTKTIQYEFEHTLFQDLHQNPEAGSSVVVKKKAKSMDDSFSLDRSPTDPRFAVGDGSNDTNIIAMQYGAIVQSPASTISTNEEAATSRSAQNDVQMEPYYLDQPQSPGDLQWSSAWNNAGTAMGYMISDSPRLPRVASCTSDEMAFKSTWVDSSFVETSDRRSSVDDAKPDTVECAAPFPYQSQVGYSSAPSCSTDWPTSNSPWVLSMGDSTSILSGMGNFDMIPEPAAKSAQCSPWTPGSDYRLTIDSLPKGLAPIPDK